MFVNVQSLVANLHRIELVLNEHCPDICVCTEARVTENILDTEISVASYKILRSSSTTRHSGGIIVYVKDNIKVRLINDWSDQNDNILTFFIDNSCCRGVWITTYHSPNSNHIAFIQRLSSIYDTHVPSTSKSYVCGDLNIDLKSNNLSASLRDAVRYFETRNRLRQIVKKFTRVTQTSKTLIDHCYTNDLTVKTEVHDSITVADHKLITIVKASRNRDYVCKTSFDRTRCTAENIALIFNSTVTNTNFVDIGTNLGFQILHSAIEKSVNDLVTMKTVIPSQSKRWFTNDLRNLRQEESVAHNQALTYNSVESWAKYRMIRNRYNREVSRAKSQEIQNIIKECRNDRKQLWKELKKLTTDHTTLPDYINFDTTYVSNKAEIANKLNQFFVSSISEINQSIDNIPLDLTNIITPEILFDKFAPVTIEQITTILQAMKPNSGVNNVNRDIILNLLPNCQLTLVTLINKSLEDGIFPEALKYTVVTPIPKVKGSNRAEDMRPINSACTLDKLLQIIVKIQLQDHVDRCQILSPRQSAYRQYHSCETALNLILIDWKEAKSEKKVIVAVFLDFKKAFETVDRTILCEVLRSYGVSGIVIRWFKSWLEGRRQYTRYGDQTSEETRNDYGVPQGTPLSCIMFLLYINIIAQVPLHCKISLFADDTLVWVVADNVADAIRLINIDLERICSFLKMMKLKLNVGKTKAMVINARQQTIHDIIVQGEIIEIVDSLKYLGVIVDNKLTFSENIDYMAKKVAKKVGLLGRIRKNIGRDTALSLFKTTVTPHFDFCSTILLIANEGQFKQLQLLMNKALRIIERASRREHIHDMLEATGLLDVKQRVFHNVLMMIYRVHNKMLPEYLCRHFSRLCDIQPYNLRNPNQLRMPTYLSSSAQNSFKYKGAQIYNEFTRLTKTDATANESEYRRAVKLYVKSNVSIHRIIDEQ